MLLVDGSAMLNQVYSAFFWQFAPEKSRHINTFHLTGKSLRLKLRSLENLKENVIEGSRGKFQELMFWFH
jgi:hypothetical protein